MSADRWHRINAVFADALGLAPEARSPFLDRACAGDPGLRAEVEAMLDAEASAASFFESAAEHVASAALSISTVPPERAGPWRPVRLLGRGGMGEVYLAERIGADAPGGFAQEAALKLVQPGLAPDLVRRFHAERRILAGLDHPGIARLLDGGTASDGRPYLAMEVVRGEPITTYCDRHRLGVDARLALFAQVCEAVAYAHRHLIVHRDLKPSNVLVATGVQSNETGGAPTEASGARGQTPRIKLLDFGVARLLESNASGDVRTAPGALTPEYAAPEQLTGEAISTATDVYALGVLLYELLAGQRPFQLPSRLAHEAARIILETTPTDPSAAVLTAAPEASGDTRTPDTVAGARATEPGRLRKRLQGDLDRIAQMALRKEPGRRYASAADLGRDVERHLAGLPVEAQPATLGYRLGRFVRRHRTGVVASGIGLMMLIAYAATVTVQRAATQGERDRAESYAALLESVFDDANPYADAASGVTASTPLGEALVAAAERVERDLADDPATRQRLLASIAGSLSSIGADSLAAAVYATHLRLAGADFPGETAERARALSASGYHLFESGTSAERFERAERLLREALAISEAVYGKSAPETGDVLVSLATVLKDAGDPGRAEPLAARAVAIARQRPGSRRLATALMIHALILDAQGQTDRAWTAAQDMLRRQRRSLPDSSVNLVSALANASTLAQNAGHLDAAAQLEAEAAAIATMRLGPDHPVTLTVRSNYASTLQSLGRFRDAEREQRVVLSQRLARFGADSYEAGVSAQGLAGILWDLNETDEAARLYRQASGAFDASLPADHFTRALPHLSLARLLADLGRGAEAERHAREAVAITTQSVAGDHPAAGDAQARLGRALLLQGRETLGREHLNRGLAVLRAALGVDHEKVRDAEAWGTVP